MKTQNFKDRIIVITGAASGIGEGTARRFAADVATLVLGGRDAAGFATLAADLDDVTIETPETDVSDMLRAKPWSRARPTGSAGSTCWLTTPGSIISAKLASRALAMDAADPIAKFEERVPMGRDAEPKDIAGAVAFWLATTRTI